jgi:hypothetical protein
MFKAFVEAAINYDAGAPLIRPLVTSPNGEAQVA